MAAGMQDSPRAQRIEHESKRGEALERQAQRDIDRGEIAEVVAGPEDDGPESDGEFGTAELREGEHRDDDNLHARRNAAQLAMADGEGQGDDPDGGAGEMECFRCGAAIARGSHWARLSVEHHGDRAGEYADVVRKACPDCAAAVGLLEVSN